MNLQEQIELGISSSSDMVETVSYLIWGAVHTTTRAYKKVTVNISLETKKVFIKITLKWPFKGKKFKKFQDAWLRIAEERAKEFVPEGFKAVYYYG